MFLLVLYKTCWIIERGNTSDENEKKKKAAKERSEGWAKERDQNITSKNRNGFEIYVSYLNVFSFFPPPQIAYLWSRSRILKSLENNLEEGQAFMSNFDMSFVIKNV